MSQRLKLVQAWRKLSYTFVITDKIRAAGVIFLPFYPHRSPANTQIRQTEKVTYQDCNVVADELRQRSISAHYEVERFEINLVERRMPRKQTIQMTHSACLQEQLAEY
jgi:hypothetical protein